MSAPAAPAREGPGADGDRERREELAGSLAAVRERVAAAERAAGRPAGSTSLVVVTKFFPAADVRLLAGLGVAAVGESREPEASEKAAACADLPLVWHQVGQVQTRKAAAVAAWAHVVHSVDRPRLVAALSSALGRDRERAEERSAAGDLRCLVQVSLDGDPARGGVVPEDLAALADAVAAAPGLELAGVMAIAPAGVPARAPLEDLATMAKRLRRDHPGATWVSAGMSGDLEDAVAVGATHVRIGRAVLGDRRDVR